MVRPAFERQVGRLTLLEATSPRALDLAMDPLDTNSSELNFRAPRPWATTSSFETPEGHRDGAAAIAGRGLITGTGTRRRHLAASCAPPLAARTSSWSVRTSWM